MTTTPTNKPEPKARRKYTKEFKQQAVVLSQRPGMSVRQAAQDLGINESMLYDWAKKADAEGSDAFRGHGIRTEQAARIAALEQENRILREERDILKKATAFFAKERR